LPRQFGEEEALVCVPYRSGNWINMFAELY
jgi:hypothetical protein